MAVYVFEGLDGAGKGSVIAALKAELGAVVVKTPLEPFKSLMGMFDLSQLDALTGKQERREFLLARLKFFLGANIQAALEVFRGPGCILVDRWLYTTLAYHYAFDPGLEDVLESTPYVSVLRPDHTFLVSVRDRSDWLSRMLTRADGGSYIDRWLIRDGELADRVMDNYRRIIPSFTEVTNDGALADTVSTVLGCLGATLC